MTHPASPPENPAETAMRSYLQRIATGPELSRDLSFEEARDGMGLILGGRVDPVQAGVFLIALRMKRETDDENRGVLAAIRDATRRVDADVDELVDIADPYDGYNRTLPAAPFLPALLAACGVAAISHGVRRVGPKHGATHHLVLSEAGIAVDDAPGEVARRIADPAIGWGYLDQSRFCPELHNLMDLRELIVKRPAITTAEVLAGPVRARRATHLMTGYVHKAYPRIYALLARDAGFHSALLVRGTEGGVLPSLRQAAKICCYHAGGEEREIEIAPSEVGIVQTLRAPPLPDDLPGYRRKTEEAEPSADAGAIATAAARAGMSALEGEAGPTFDALVYGAALCLWHLGREPTLAGGAGTAREALLSGRARAHFRG